MRIFGRTELFKLKTPILEILGLLIFYLLPKKTSQFFIETLFQELSTGTITTASK